MTDGAVSAKPLSELQASRPCFGGMSGARQFARRLADWLAGAAVVSLPWSTSATAVLVGLFAVAALAGASRAEMKEACTRPAVLWAVGLWLLACLGLAWSEASWPERLEGLRGFHKLLVIPLLMLHFRRSPHGPKVFAAFLVSLVGLQIASWLSWHWPQFTLPRRPPGVPVKDTIYQGMFFGLASGIFASLAISAWVSRRRWAAAGSGLLAALFIVNLMFVPNSRTALVVVPVLFVVVGAQVYGRRGVLAGLIACSVIAPVGWLASPDLRDRVTAIATHMESGAAGTSEGLRMSFWHNAVAAIKAAPVLGHGTGSVGTAFKRIVRDGPDTAITQNPHNQTFLVGVQLGVAGVILLWGMWLCHFWLFLQAGWVGRIGMLIVVQNVVSSIFNSHLSDFTAGWLYVLGVGILGGIVLGSRPKADG